MEKSFVMMKPDAVARRLMGKILTRFEEKGLQRAERRAEHSRRGGPGRAGHHTPLHGQGQESHR